MNERELEDIICKYPELIEDGLSFKGRQVNVKGKRVDILFEDSRGYKLIVELKKGTVVRRDVAQLLDYEGYFLSFADPKVRVMLVGNRVPENLRRSLDHHGFEWKELQAAVLTEFLGERNDVKMLGCLAGEDVATFQCPSDEKRKKELPKRNEKRFEFFKQLLSLCNKETPIFKSVSPNGYQYWISAGAGKAGLSWAFNAQKRNTNASVELYFCSDATELNQFRFKSLAEKKTEIEERFGELLIWDFKDNQKQQHILSKCPLGGVEDEEKWEVIQNDLVSRFVRLEKALRPYLEILK